MRESSNWAWPAAGSDFLAVMRDFLWRTNVYSNGDCEETLDWQPFWDWLRADRLADIDEVSECDLAVCGRWPGWNFWEENDL